MSSSTEAEGMSTLNISSSSTNFFLLWCLFSGVDAVVVEGSGGLCLTLGGAFSVELGVLPLLQQKIIIFFIITQHTFEKGERNWCKIEGVH